jgi:dienelactone hydrolase
MHVEDIEYQVAGRRMLGHYAVDRDRAGPRPAVLLSHEGNGLDEHVKGRAERLAEVGYAAFALDYHGDGRTLPLDRARQVVGALMADADRTRTLARAGLDVLLGQPEADRSRVAAIGYCFGGSMSLELARSGADVKAIVGFHPALTSTRPADSRNITGSVLMCCGSDDPLVPAEQRAAFESEMHDAGVTDWTMLVFGGAVHSFTNPAADQLGIPALRYDAAADRRSWRAMLDLFEEALGPS